MKSKSESEQRLEALGWDFVPTGPNEWEWVKFKDGAPIARQGDDIWRRDSGASSAQD